MNTNVEYYEKINRLQDIQHQSEGERMELERQLNTYMKSDKRLSKLKAVRLQNYWKKICDDEKKSQWRNEQLLRDFDRVEAHMADLHSRTEKLRTMKRQYEEHVERMYPDWKQRIFHFQRLKEREEKLEIQREEEKNRAAINSMSQQQQYIDASRLYSHMPPQHLESQQQDHMISQQQQQQQQMSGISTSVLSQMPSQDAHSQGYRPHEDSTSNYHITTLSNYERGTSKGPNNGTSTIQSLSTIATGTGLSTGYSGQAVQATSTPHPGHQMEYRGSRVHGKIEEESPRQPSRQSGSSNSRETSQAPPAAPVTQKEVDAFMTENEQNSYGHSVEALNGHQSNHKTPSPVRTRNNRFEEAIEEIEDVSEYGSEHHSPLSARGSKHKPSSQHSSKTSLNKSPEGSHHGSKSSLQKSPKSSHHGSKSSLNKSQTGTRNQEADQSIYLEAEITWDGLYNLMAAVSEQLRTTADKLVYRGDPPAKSVREEIIANANRGQMLSYMDTTSLSMVIVDQLPLLSSATQERCILHDSLLYKQLAVLSPAVVRSKIKPTLQGHWDKLYEHFTEVLRCRAMSPQEIAETFAPLLISSDSPYESQAAGLLSKLLEETLSEEGMNSPHSTSTFSATPRPKPMALQKATDSEEEEDIFDQDVPKHINTAALTQSAAYRQVVGSTLGSTQKSVSYIDSGDEDDIENEVIGGRKKSSISDSPVRKPSALEEQFQREGSFKGPTSPKGSLGSPVRDGALSPASLGSGGIRSPSPLSGGGGIGGPGAYVPSGLVDTGRSAAGQSTVSSFGSTGKKLGFMYGDSDTDEDIELPGTDRQPRYDDDDFNP